MSVEKGECAIAPRLEHFVEVPFNPSVAFYAAVVWSVH